MQQIALPPWANVQLDVRQIRFPGRVTGRQLFLDVSVADRAEGNSSQMVLWFLFVELEEKGFNCNPRVRFVLVLICGPDEGGFSPPDSIGGVERGERNVALENIVKLAKALSVSPRDLFADFP